METIFTFKSDDLVSGCVLDRYFISYVN